MSRTAVSRSTSPSRSRSDGSSQSSSVPTASSAAATNVPDAVARQRAARRVDRQEPLVAQVLGGLLGAAAGADVPEHLDLRGRELQLAAELTDLAAERGDGAGREPVGHPALVEERDAEHGATGLAHDELGDVATRPRPFGAMRTDLRVDDLADERRGLPDLDGGSRSTTSPASA
jgi:hypothetical protein